MKKFQKSKIFIALLIFSSLLISCSKSDENKFVQEWLTTANLSAKQTPDELYKAALLEDTLVIYSETTRALDVAKSFMKEYPGLTVSVVDVRANEIIEMLNNNFDNNNFLCDVLIRNDNDGMLSKDLMTRGVVNQYIPYDIKDNLIPVENTQTLLLVSELQMLSYNDKIHKEPPITNWWELIEPKWKDKVIMANPMRSITTFAFLSMLIENDALLRNSYEEFYKRPLNLSEDKNAGEFFIESLIDNGLIITNSSDEVAQMVGEPNISKSMLGIMISSKIRLSEIGYNLELAYNVEPFCGVYLPNSISIATGSKNVNSSKLFIRYILGEADGQGEGYKPYLQNGAWSVRSDVQSESSVPLDDLNYLTVDSSYVYDNNKKLKDFWLSLQ